MLTDTKIRALKTPEKTKKIFDGDGLYLELSPSGGKWWRLKYYHLGKEKRLSLGTYPDRSLLDARRFRDDAKRLLLDGVDPSAARKADKITTKVAAENSFEAVARLWHKSWSKTRTNKHSDQVLRRLELDVFPQIGFMPINEIKATHIVAIAKKVEARGANDLARRAIQISGQVFRYSIGHGMAEHNPAGEIQPSDVLAPVVEQNHARVELSELPKLLHEIDKYFGHPRTRISLQLAALTFVRPSELVGAPWSEFDFKAEQWRIPKERMKMPTPHIVPLARQTIELLKELRGISRGELLFPNARDHEKAMSTNAPLFALYKLGYKGKMTVHGFRGVASTALHEQGYEHAHIELQLAHIERDRISAAYNHAMYIKQRTKMMHEWADYLDSLRAA